MGKSPFFMGKSSKNHGEIPEIPRGYHHSGSTSINFDISRFSNWRFFGRRARHFSCCGASGAANCKAMPQDFTAARTTSQRSKTHENGDLMVI